MSFRDSMFLLAESRERPTHVGSLMLFDRPEGAGPDHLGELHRRLLAAGPESVAAYFRRRAERPLSSLGQWSWTEDTDLDIEYHVRLSALPRPGRIRELLELVSRLHGSLLDRHRPLWEFHLIEGVEGDRFAVYGKVHHAMMDGVTSMRHLQKTLSTDPTDSPMPPFWAVDPRGRRRTPTGPDGSGQDGSGRDASGHDTPERDTSGQDRSGSIGSLASGPWRAARSVLDTAGDLLGIGPAMVSTLARGWSDDPVTLPFEAPPSVLNTPITGARRFAAESWPLKRIQRVARRTGATLNDVVLAMSAGALRRYLDDLGELPGRPLVSALPVALGGSDGTGNRLGAVLVGLATDEPDPAKRFARIRASARAAKDNLAERSPTQVAALSLAVAAPLALGAIPGTSALPQGFNLIISNVPGPTEPLYWDGAKLGGVYPVSVPLDGQALNITVTSYADHMEFGLTGCRRRVPRLQRMLGFLEASLVELEEIPDAGVVGEDD